MTARVFHADLWGSRDDKYRWLLDHAIDTTDWGALDPGTPFYLFRPQDVGLRAEYDAGWRVTDIFPINGVGITTARDHVVIDFEEDPILQRARLFRDSRESDVELCRTLGIPQKKGWNIGNARELIRRESDLRQFIKPVLYRPFDWRLIFYHDSLVWRTVKRVMHHMLAGPNVSLISARSNKSSEMDHFFTTRSIMETKCGERTTQSCQFPLYVHTETDVVARREREHSRTQAAAPAVRSANLGRPFLDALANNLGLWFLSDGGGDLEATFGPEDVLHYIYAVLHSPTYRERYAEFLRIDFPRIPLTTNRELFRELCGLGAELVALHLLESPRVNQFITRYPVAGDNRVEAGHPRYLAPGQAGPSSHRRDAGATPPDAGGARAGRVYISKDNRRQNRQGQYFEGVPPEVWEFHVGGYQVCEKWLKDRRDRNLSFDELTRYQQIVVALHETIRLMGEIDRAIESHGGWPLR
jgi:hypothetical protein